MEFIEYPKWITLPNGERIVVRDRAEEDEKLAPVQHSVDPSPEPDDADEAEPSPVRKRKGK